MFFIWAHGDESLKTFIDAIKVLTRCTYEYHKEIINFLDPPAELANAGLTTKMYVKPTDWLH